MKLQKILNNRKGFTLMEIIVVLIIIAVLAAALIPSFVGFIRDARAASVINEARVGMTAAQAVVTHTLASGGTITSPIANATVGGQPIGSTTRFIDYVTGDVTTPGGFSQIVVTGDRVTGLLYTTPGWTVTIVAGGQATATRVP